MDIIPRIATVIGIVGGLLAVIGFFQQRYAPKALTALKEHVDEKLSEQHAEIEVLKKQIGLFWGMAERQMSLLLHSPHRRELDKLLDKNISRERLTRQEAEDLVELLHKFIHSGELNPDEVGFATFLMSVTVGKYELDEKYEQPEKVGH